MSGHHPFKELTKGWPADRRRAVEERTASLLTDIQDAELAELRKALKVSQGRHKGSSSMGKSSWARETGELLDKEPPQRRGKRIKR